ncbi:MAG: nucleotidyl transferase AbiEii/AbiGii toxin family protein, partial [Halohasta sp.]
MLQKNTVEPHTLEVLEHLSADTHLNNFQLAGGTGLALHIGHRKSIDLDFFSLDSFDADNLLQYLES